MKIRPRERLLACALRLGLARADAEDLVQEAYMILLVRLLNEPIQDWFGFLVGCLHWLAANARTRDGRRARRLEQQPPAPTVEPDPQDQLVARCVVDRALDGLPLDDRELLRRRYAEDTSLHGIAERLGIAEDAVRKRIHRALAKAQAAFASTESAEQRIDVL